jgi:hypothetical protein
MLALFSTVVDLYSFHYRRNWRALLRGMAFSLVWHIPSWFQTAAQSTVESCGLLINVLNFHVRVASTTLLWVFREMSVVFDCHIRTCFQPFVSQMFGISELFLACINLRSFFCPSDLHALVFGAHRFQHAHLNSALHCRALLLRHLRTVYRSRQFGLLGKLRSDAKPALRLELCARGGSHSRGAAERNVTVIVTALSNLDKTTILMLSGSRCLVLSFSSSESQTLHFRLTEAPTEKVRNGGDGGPEPVSRPGCARQASIANLPFDLDVASISDIQNRSVSSIFRAS